MNPLTNPMSTTIFSTVTSTAAPLTLAHLIVPYSKVMDAISREKPRTNRVKLDECSLNTWRLNRVPRL